MSGKREALSVAVGPVAPQKRKKDCTCQANSKSLFNLIGPSPFCFRADLSNVIKRVLDSERVADIELLEVLEKNSETIFPANRDQFFRMVLTSKLPDSAIFLIKEYPRDVENAIAAEEHSIVFDMKEDKVVLEILQTFSPNSWKAMYTNGLKENTIHIFVQKMFIRSLNWVLNNEKEIAEKLLFEPNAAGNLPIMTNLTKGDQDVAIEIWKNMEISKTTSLEGVLQLKNRKNESIFQLCASYDQNQLLLEMCTSETLTKECIMKALVEQNPDGQTTLNMCRDETVLMTILKSIDISKLEIGKLDKKGKNILHHMAQKDFSQVIKLLNEKLPDTQFKDMILQQSSSNKSNVLMTAAVFSSEKSLNMLLHIVSLLKSFEGKETLEKILHTKNEYNDNLLGLVLQHKDSLHISKHILLELEGKFHSNTDDMEKCFHDNLTPSIEVLEAIQAVDRTKPKSRCTVMSIRAKTFVTSFCIPVALMAVDIGFDVALVRVFKDADPVCLTTQWEACGTTTAACAPNTLYLGACNATRASAFSNITTACGSNTRTWDWEPSDVQSASPFFCIPLKLALGPRFYYSLGFIIWPWVYYFIEFWQSTIFGSIYEVICGCCFKRLTLNVLQDFKNTWYTMKWSCKGIGKMFWMTTMTLFLVLYHIIFWPFEMHRKKFVSEVCYLTTNGQEQIKARKKRDNDTIISSRSQMIEVCSESSFQPLIQLYLYLPTLMVSFAVAAVTFDTSKSASSLFEDVHTLEFWSILTSCLSLAWSFTYYQSVKKNGALSFSANPLGRLCLLLSNILQISSRLLAIVLFAYCWGEGNFLPAFAAVVLHIILMAGILSRPWPCRADKWSCMKAVWEGILNGISNLYIHNIILPSPTRGKKTQQKKRNPTFKSQVLVDTVFIIENIGIIILVFSLIPDICYTTGLIWILLFIVVGQFLGLLLKVVYYQFFHIWSNILVCPCAKNKEHIV